MSSSFITFLKLSKSRNKANNILSNKVSSISLNNVSFSILIILVSTSAPSFTILSYITSSPIFD